LNNQNIFDKNKSSILAEKQILKTELLKLNVVRNVYPSDANFLLVEFDNADDVYSYLVSQSIITRNRTTQVKNCIRISIGTSEENQKLVTALKNRA